MWRKVTSETDTLADFKKEVELFLCSFGKQTPTRGRPQLGPHRKI